MQQFRDDGYLPEAMVNYLALLGWSLDDHTELFTLADLERWFSLERVSRNPAAFDIKKLDALNGHYLRQLEPADFAPGLAVRGGGRARRADQGLLTKAAPLVQERVNHLTEVPGMVGFLLSDEVELDPAAAAKVLTDDGRAFLAEAAKRLEEVEPWTADAVEGPCAASRPTAASSPGPPSSRSAWPSPAGWSARPCSSPWSCSASPAPWPAWSGPPPCPVERSARRPLRCPSPWAPAHDPWGVG